MLSIRTCAESFSITNDGISSVNVTVTLSLDTLTVPVLIEFFNAVA